MCSSAVQAWPVLVNSHILVSVRTCLYASKCTLFYLTVSYCFIPEEKRTHLNFVKVIGFPDLVYSLELQVHCHKTGFIDAIFIASFYYL
jgi:hypothetical protein